MLKDPEAAEYLGVSESYLRQSRCRNTTVTDAPPFVKFGKTVRYVVADLDAWLAAHRVGARDAND